MQYAASITLMQKPSLLKFTLKLLLLVSLSTLSGCNSEPTKPALAVKPVAVKKETISMVCEPATVITTEPVIIKEACNCQCDQQKELVIQPAEPVKAEPNSVPSVPDFSLLKRSSWEFIDGFHTQDLKQAWPAWQQSCTALIKKSHWQTACSAASTLNAQYAGNPTHAAIKNYFLRYFDVFKTTNTDGSDTGMITGYYAPSLKGSRTKSAKYPYPLYLQPNDLVSVDLSEQYPALKHKRIRGRVVGNKLVPYYTRAELAMNPSPIKGAEFVYINDIIDVFFLQIQGSGVVELDTGESLHVGYANQNGHPYRSIGRVLIRNNQLKASEASMQGIKNWARRNPSQLRKLLNSNPSFVFFRELPLNLPGPLGALGVPLLAERAVAVDKRHIPLGAPVFLSTTQPNSQIPLKQLMMAQDTGGAIKGGVRADFYWGAGFDAGKKAGSMKQAGKIWVLLPKGYPLPNSQY